MTTELPADVPRSNGELLFEFPWESRAFGLAVALADAGALQWDDFRAELVDAIAGRDPDAPYRYYEHWLTALERALVSTGVVDTKTLVASVRSVMEHKEH
ncbi:nitrile hydratase accessory protein [Lentzea tibetensis]|uniref:Nitrile hydratase accessory protein n=1 Tax=Lentzea tibetensis TaxID=2591470 RepID=A0A563F1L0_9PSEU|nr:nitrile hydratase accessory protein [Lentzea tibetensis]TWP53809.1 nitrile hydratase accessory protein [Lentzea tibetensis]